MKFRKISSALLFATASLTPAAAFSEDAPPPPQDIWTGKGQAGYVASQGNTSAKSANAAIEMAYYQAEWKHAFHLGGLYGQSNGITSASRWDAGWQSNYQITKPLYVFGALRYARDNFSGFQYQASGSVGLGYIVIDTTTTKLDAQVGAGYRTLRPETLTKAPSGAVVARTLLASESNAILTGAVNYAWKITDTTTLSNKLLVEWGANNTLISDGLALAVKISTKLALSLGYSLQENTRPPVGLKKLDALETVNLVYSF